MTYVLSENAGRELEYITETQPGSGIAVSTAVTSEPKKKEEMLEENGFELLREAFEEDYILQEDKTYEWIGASASIRSDKPYCPVLSYEDYYTLDQYDSRNVQCRAEGNYICKTADFSITYNGTFYEDCRMVLIILQPQINSDTSVPETKLSVFYRIPKGYDGCVLGFHNLSALTKEQIEKGMSDPAASLGLIKRAEGDLYLRLV